MADMFMVLDARTRRRVRRNGWSDLRKAFMWADANIAPDADYVVIDKRGSIVSRNRAMRILRGVR